MPDPREARVELGHDHQAGEGTNGKGPARGPFSGLVAAAKP